MLRADGVAVAGVYCAGWIKRGPTGVIGTNKKDATETVEHLLEDARDGRLARAFRGAIDELLVERDVGVVTYAGWEAIDLPSARGASRRDARASSCRPGTSCSRRAAQPESTSSVRSTSAVVL